MLKPGDLVELSARGRSTLSNIYVDKVGLVLSENKTRPWTNWAVLWTGYSEVHHHDRQELKLVKKGSRKE